MGHGDAGLGAQQVPKLGGGALDGLGAVVQVVDLAPPVQLPADGVGDQPPVVLQHIGLHRLPAHGGLLQGGHVPQAGQGHVQGAGDGSGRKGEHIHLAGQVFQLLLVAHPKALLLVHHQQP